MVYICSEDECSICSKENNVRVRLTTTVRWAGVWTNAVSALRYAHAVDVATPCSFYTGGPWYFGGFSWKTDLSSIGGTSHSSRAPLRGRVCRGSQGKRTVEPNLANGQAGTSKRFVVQCSRMLTSPFLGTASNGNCVCECEVSSACPRLD